MPDIAPGFGTQKMAPLFTRGDVDPDNSLFSGGINVSAVNRICIGPIVASNGDILVFTEWRPLREDYNCRGIWMKRSTNGGASFGQSTLIYNRTDYFYDGGASSKWMNLGVCGVNANGRVIIYFTHSDGSATARVTTCKQIYSDDNGATWSASDQSTVTDITTSIKKVDNTHPAGIDATTFDLANAAWGWYAFGPGKFYTNPSTGQLVIPCNHRYSLDQSTDAGNGIDSFDHCVISNDHGATHSLGGGFKESVAANEGTNECQIARLATGDYFLSTRMIGTGTFGDTVRGQAIITTAQLTGTWPTCTKMSDGTNDIPTSGCQGSLHVDATGDIWAVFPSNSGTRSSLVIHRSTNNGTSFATNRRLFYGFAGYSGILETSTGNFLSIYEAVDDYENATVTDGLNSAQFVRVTRWSKDWFTDESTYPGVATYYLNDGVIGAATYTGGTEIGCWEGYGPPGKGGAGVSWDSSSVSTGGVTFAGSGAGLQMQSAQTGNNGGMWDAGLKSITYEWIVKFDTTATTWTLFDNRANSGRGCTVQINAGVVSAAMNDGTTTATASSGAAVSGSSVYHNIAVVLNRGVTLRVYVDGVLNSSTSDGMSATAGVTGSAVARVGSLTGGTSPAPAGTSIRMMRVTHKAVTTGNMLAVAATKPSLSTLIGYVPTASTTIPSTSNLKMALFAPGLGGVGAYGIADRYGGNSYPMGPPIDGTCISSYEDRSSLNRLFVTNSQNRGSFWDTDTEFGRHVRLSKGNTTNAAVDLFKRSAASTDLDFIQNTGVFSVLMCVNRVTDSFSDYAILMDNINNSGANNGFSMFVNTTTNTVQATIGVGSANFNEAMSGGITLNRWYFLGVVGNGRGSKVHFYKSIYTTGTPATITKVDSSGNITGTDGTFASTLALGIGARSESTKGGDFRFGPILVFNSSLTPTQVASWAAVMNTAPVVGSSRQQGGFGFGFGFRI